MKKGKLEFTSHTANLALMRNFVRKFLSRQPFTEKQRTLMVLGGFLLIYAWVLLVWVGWDVRGGTAFFSVMCAVSGVIGLALVLWGYVERRRVLRLRLHLRSEERRERVRRLQ